MSQKVEFSITTNWFWTNELIEASSKLVVLLEYVPFIPPVVFKEKIEINMKTDKT